MRWGYSDHAVDFAASKRGITRKEIILDFFELNPHILKQKPVQCTKCQAGASQLKSVHAYL